MERDVGRVEEERRWRTKAEDSYGGNASVKWSSNAAGHVLTLKIG